MSPPAKPTLAANLAAQLDQVQLAPPPPAPIIINVQAGGSLTLLVGGTGSFASQDLPGSEAS